MAHSEVEPEDLMGRLHRLMAREELDKAVELMGTHQQFLRDNVMEVVPTLFTFLSEDKAGSEPFCAACLERVVAVCKPKECVAALLEQLSGAAQDMPRLRVAVAGLKMAHVNVPRSLDFTLKSLGVVASTVDVKRTDHVQCVCVTLLEFVTPFVGVGLSRGMLAGFVIGIAQPLAHVDIKKGLWECTERLVVLTCQLMDLSLILGLLESIPSSSFKPRMRLSTDMKVPQTALGMVMYMVFAEGVCLDSLPQVYSPVHLLQLLIPFAACLMKDAGQDQAVRKGLLLAQSFLSRVPTRSLLPHVLNWPFHAQFVDSLAAVAVFCQSEDHRKLAVRVLSDYLTRFDSQAKWEILMGMFGRVKHSGLYGYLVTKVKDEVAASLAGQALSKPFSGSSLRQIASQVCRLDNDADVLDNYDKIVCTLNFLVFLLMRDGQNRSGVWDWVADIQSEFVEPLRNSLGACYEDARRQLEVLEGGKAEGLDPNLVVSVGGQLLPTNMPVADKRDVVASSLVHLDVVRDGLDRVCKCIESRVA